MATTTETAQTVTLVLAKLQGLTATIEKHTPLVRKRRNKPLKNTPGDGSNTIQHVQDPVVDYEEVTLELHPGKSQVFLAAAEAMFAQQMLDPSKATQLTLYSLSDSGAPLDQRTGHLAVIQEMHTPEGDTNTHALATAKIVVDIVGITQ